jgi:hypothetical protein
VARIGRGEVYTGFWWGSPKVKDHREDLCLGGNINVDLREIGIDGANWIRLAQDSVQWRACEHANEPSGSIQSRIFLTS